MADGRSSREGGVEVEAVPGSHSTMFLEPHSTALAARLQARLDSYDASSEGHAGKGRIVALTGTQVA